MNNEITVKRLYNIKKWIERTFNENILFRIEHNGCIWGTDPNRDWNRVYIEKDIVRIWGIGPEGHKSYNWYDHGAIKNWEI